MTVESGPTFSNGSPPLSIVLTGTSALGNPSDLRLNLTGHVDSVDLQQTVELYDYVAGAWVVVSTTAGTTSDSTQTAISTNPGRFVAVWDTPGEGAAILEAGRPDLRIPLVCLHRPGRLERLAVSATATVTANLALSPPNLTGLTDGDSSAIPATLYQGLQPAFWRIGSATQAKPYRARLRAPKTRFRP